MGQTLIEWLLEKNLEKTTVEEELAKQAATNAAWEKQESEIYRNPNIYTFIPIPHNHNRANDTTTRDTIFIVLFSVLLFLTVMFMFGAL